MCPINEIVWTAIFHVSFHLVITGVVTDKKKIQIAYRQLSFSDLLLKYRKYSKPDVKLIHISEDNKLRIYK
jgi:hypothetical protein